MKKLFIILVLLFCQYAVSSQSCLPEGIEFTTQAQIDSFQINYPGCTEIEGSVLIAGQAIGIDNISNLNGLSSLASIGGQFNIGYQQFYFNHSLPNLSGLENLTSIGGNFGIQGTNLVSIAELENLTSIGGILRIRSNESLISLSGLDNIDTASISDLRITYNPNLSKCQVESVCAYLANPNGYIEIYDNANGCNSPEEIQDSCVANAVRVDEQFIKDNLLLYPNPAHQELNISAEGFIIDAVSIYTLTGQQAMRHRPEGKRIDISTLQPGMYMVEVTIEGRKVRHKLVVE